MSLKFTQIRILRTVVLVATMSSMGSLNRAMADQWSGLYVGAQGGAAWTDNATWRFNNVGGGLWTGTAPFEFPLSLGESYAVGTQAGYLHQFGMAIVGVEVSYSASNLNSRISSPAFPLIDTWRMDVNGIFTATGRLGLTWGHWQGYVKGGYAEVHEEVLLITTAGGFVNDQSTVRESGWTVGGGVEFQLAPNLSLGIEYDRIEIATAGYDLSAQLPATSLSVDLDPIDMVTARLNFRLAPKEARQVPIK